MAAYEPLSFKVASTLAAQRVVKVSASQTVGYPAAATDSVVGITTDTVLDTTSAIPVQVAGIAKLLFNQTVAAGGLVAADTAGRGVALAEATASGGYIGVLVGDAVDATGTIAEVLIQPGRVSAG